MVFIDMNNQNEHLLRNRVVIAPYPSLLTACGLCTTIGKITSTLSSLLRPTTILHSRRSLCDRASSKTVPLRCTITHTNPGLKTTASSTFTEKLPRAPPIRALQEPRHSLGQRSPCSKPFAWKKPTGCQKHRIIVDRSNPQHPWRLNRR